MLVKVTVLPPPAFLLEKAPELETLKSSPATWALKSAPVTETEAALLPSYVLLLAVMPDKVMALRATVTMAD